jgi:hypothetical protein
MKYGFWAIEALGDGGPESVLVSDWIFTYQVAELTARKAYSLGGMFPRAM